MLRDPRVMELFLELSGVMGSGLSHGNHIVSRFGILSYCVECAVMGPHDVQSANSVFH